MSRIRKKRRRAAAHREFGGIEMIEQATVQLLPSNNPQPYA